MLSKLTTNAKKLFFYVKRLFVRVIEDRLSLVSAGVAFFIFLSIFPAIASIISLYGIFTDSADIKNHLNYFSTLVPADVLTLIEAQVVRFTESEQQKLGWGFLVGLTLSIWGANKAMRAVAQALNIAFDFKEDRNFIKVNLVTLGLTFVSSIAFTFALSVLIIVPVLISSILTAKLAEGALILVSWGLLVVVIFFVFTLMYRKAPAMHGKIPTRKLVPGSMTATALLMLGSLVFSVYVANFGKYDAQYGALASVVITMFWLYLGAFIFLVGAEVNAIIHNNSSRSDRSQERVSAQEA